MCVTFTVVKFVFFLLFFFLQGLQEQSLHYDKMLLGCSSTGGFCNYHNRTHSVMSRCVVCCACTCENYSGQRVELVLTSSGLDLLFVFFRHPLRQKPPQKIGHASLKMDGKSCVFTAALDLVLTHEAVAAKQSLFQIPIIFFFLFSFSRTL